ncbi:MAG: hypothetical protein ACHQNT_10355 [Bacteroidia bacterium]
MKTQQSTSSLRLEASGIIKIVVKWYKHLLIVAVIATIAGWIFSSPAFIKPLFKSRAVIYPSNLGSYSTENATEQLIQLFQSEDIRDRLIKDFDLFNHYKIDTTAKYPFTALYGMMKERIKVAKTEYESAELEVLDTDPLVASNICDSMISYLNYKALSLQRMKYAEVVIIFRDQINIKKNEMDSMESAIKRLRTDYGVLEFEEQIKPFSKEYYRAVSAGQAGNGNSKLDKIKTDLAEKGGEYISLKEHLWRVRGTYNDLKIEYENAIKNYTKVLTFCNVVTKPIPAEKKSSPVRSMIVLGVIAVSVFLSFIVILIMEKRKEELS